jgi:hypothetical protein
MLIEKYDLNVFTPPCEQGAKRFSEVAHLTVDISQVLPYLNAALRGAGLESSRPGIMRRVHSPVVMLMAVVSI